MDCRLYGSETDCVRTMWNGFVQLKQTVTEFIVAKAVEQNRAQVPILKEIYRLYRGAIQRRRLSGIKFVL